MASRAAIDGGSSSSASGVRLLAAYDAVAFFHKPSGMATHPYRREERAVAPAGNFDCPICGKCFPSSEHVKGWISMVSHVTNSGDSAHRAWVRANPDRLKKDKYMDEATLWRVIQRWPQPLPWERGSQQEGERTVRFVNRLDRGTSGIVVVAASAESARALSDAWQDDVEKVYLAMVRGKCQSTFTVDRGLRDRDARGPRKVTRDAATSFELIHTVGEGAFSILRCRLVRGGRRHQIRRHLNSAGHQIVGDSKYGKSGINKWLRDAFGLERMFLHCEATRLTLPDSGERIEVHDALPADLQSCVIAFTYKHP